ncbi:MAG TPA: hypothetical protein VM901_06785 [Bdellovibrionota bacterium]|jgi:hypothetical protein|nr:hypothetical protein [Bdellovibrionota bacterium]
MKKSLLITTTLIAGMGASLSHAAPASQLDLAPLVERAIESLDTGDSTPQQELDINKVNAVIAAARDKVLPEFADFVDSANASIDAATFNLDTLTVDLSTDVTIKKSAWASNAPTTFKAELGTKTIAQDGDKLSAQVQVGLTTQVLELVKFGANYVLEQNPVNPDAPDDAEDALFRTFFTELKAAENLDAVYAKVFELRDTVLASTSEELAKLREGFQELTFLADDGIMTIDLKPTDFYGVRFSAGVTVSPAQVSVKVSGVDLENALKEQIDEYKDQIVQTLLTVQNADEEVRTEIEDGFRYLIGAAREVVGTKVAE